jgi:minor extracellular serine protease Vpr
MAPATAQDTSVVQQPEFLYYHLGAARTFYHTTDQKREVWLRVDGAPGDYTVQLVGAAVHSGRFDATLTRGAQGTRFLSFVVPGSIWDGATSQYNIAPNCYVIRTSWTDIDGVGRNLHGQGDPGQLWPGSSVGPTFDGRLGVDVSAPGEQVVTAYSPTSYWGTFRFNLIQGGGSLYGMAGAVSAAAPTVTGIAALMLEMNPKLDAPTVKRILQQTARADAFTGPTPNPNWGYGKVDALAALTLVKKGLGP